MVGSTPTCFTLQQLIAKELCHISGVSYLCIFPCPPNQGLCRISVFLFQPCFPAHLIFSCVVLLFPQLCDTFFSFFQKSFFLLFSFQPQTQVFFCNAQSIEKVLCLTFSYTYLLPLQFYLVHLFLPSFS